MSNENVGDHATVFQILFVIFALEERFSLSFFYQELYGPNTICIQLLNMISRNNLARFDILNYKGYDISGRFFSLIQSFISNRERKVGLNSYSSRSFA